MIGFQWEKNLRIFYGSVKIAKEYTKTEKDIYVCGTYIPPQNSSYFYPELFEELENDIEKFSAFGSILLMGDFNSRTGKYSDNVKRATPL